ncbi:MAG: hypothetical protein DI598_03025 [Pseudopedobacter saltans]|uniref:HTH araC/xylS-type domain-containing protein n=1 Tax=Pseudopedobacter saltans TaxID=151895 RepID=A0A2W5FD10_9SPHI|nr:MAG: hypothetical protein DI598_03025 [Pseudopedobacter saltans]
MKVEFSLDSGERIVDIQTSVEALSSTLIATNKEKYINGSHLINFKTIHTTGLALIETSSMDDHQRKIKLHVTEPHILISFISRAPTETESINQLSLAGLIHLAYYDTNNIYASSLASPGLSFFIIMTREYYLKIFENETFSNYFDLYRSVQKNIPFVAKDKEFFFTLPMKNILRKAFNNPFRDAIKKFYIEAKLKGLVSLMQEDRMHKMSQANQHIREDILEKLHQAKGILDNNYQAPPTIRQLSRMIVLNEKDLKTQFKSLFGQTIRNYLVKLRMEAAYTMINDKNVMVFEVALRLGYKDTSHFINMFKKYFGYTPKYFCKHVKITQLVLSFIGFTEIIGLVFCESMVT